MTTEFLNFSQIIFLRLLGLPGPEEPPFLELVAIFSGMIFALYLIYFLIAYFTTTFRLKVPLKVLTDEDRPVPVSPFLFSESKIGEVNFSAKKSKWALRIIAIILILFMLITPMAQLLSPIESFFNGVYY